MVQFGGYHGAEAKKVSFFSVPFIVMWPTPRGRRPSP
jgi:hypothetical protein